MYYGGMKEGLPSLNAVRSSCAEKLASESKIEDSLYSRILEDAYQSDQALNLPELEVFGVGHVNVEAISNFSLALVDFIEKKEQEADEEELKRLYHFGQSIHAQFFSASPSLINYIRLPDRLKLMTKATRSKVVQGTFGSVFVGETVYDVSSMRGRLDEIAIKAMEELSISEKLDLLHQLRTVGAQAIANGEWARPAYNQVRQTYETLMNSNDAAVFVQLAAEAGLETLDAEYNDPQLSFMRFEGQTSDSRLNTRFSNEQVGATTAKFFSKYSLDRMVSSSTRVLPATKDALVCTDRSGLASGIIRINVPEFLSLSEGELGFDVNQYRIFKQRLDIAEQYSDRKRHEVVVKIYHAIYNEYVGELVAKGDAEHAAKVFAEALPILSEEEWQTYFVGEIKQREYPSQNELYKEAGEKNERVSHEFVTGLLGFRDQLGKRYEGDYLELEAALQHEDFEHGFEIASRITLKCQYEKQSTDVHREVSALQDEIREAHQANFEIARQKFEVSMTKLQQTEEIQAGAEIVRKIEENLGELGDKLRILIENKLATAEKLPQLEFTPLKEFITELKGNESLDRVIDEDILLLQHVHSVDLAGKIENHFGFALADLSLREQFFFLGYLKKVTAREAGALKQFVAIYGMDGMRTFLACAEEPELDEKIVEFAATKDEVVVKKIFTTYGELIDAADDAETFVRTTIECEEAECNEIAQKVRTSVLSRSQQLLSSSVRAENPVTIAEKLTHFQVAGTLFVSSFKALKEQGQVVNWEHIKNSSFERVSSAEVSPEDKEKMQHIWESYYAGKYDSKALEDSLRADFVKSFEKENVHFYLFKYKGEVASFFLSETVGEEDGVLHKHLASFMTSQSFEGGGLGLAVMEKGLEEEQKGAVLVGESDVDPVRTPIVSKYFEQYGFIATRAYDDHGEPTLALGRYENRTFEAKHMSRDYIKTFAEGGVETGRARYVVSDHVPDFQKHFTDGFVLTRYFVEKTPDEGVQYYSVFERSSEEMAVSGAR